MKPLLSFCRGGCFGHHQGGLKAKRLAQLVEPLKGDSPRKGLGDSYRLLRLRNLRPGANKGVAVALKVNHTSTVFHSASLFG